MLTKFEEIHNINIESNSLREYVDFKSENPDYIVLFQIGSFFETFFEDAKIFSDITGAQYSIRRFKNKIEIAESGVPKSYVNNYIKMLLNNGFKICICSEFSDEFGSHYREITRKYTQGTILEDEFLDRNDNNYIMAINVFDNCYNIAYADVSTGQLYKTQCNKKNYKIETDKITPNEILISKKQSEIFKSISSKFNITILDDDYFSENIEDTIEKYCKITQKKYKTKLDKIVEYQCSSYMELDELTRKNLELTRTTYLMKKKGSLLWFLNYTKTPMGMRLLKKYLSEPLMSSDDIKERQEAVEELVNNPKLIDKAQEILEQFSDISRMCSKLSNITILPKDLLGFSRNSILIGELKDLIDNLNSKIYKINPNKLNKVLNLAKTIISAIKSDCSNEVKSGNIINDGYSAELDFLKNEKSEIQNSIEKYAQQLRNKLNIDSLKISYSPTIGYYIEIPSKFSAKLSDEYRKKNSSAKVSRYATCELEKFQENIASINFKINELEFGLFKKIRILASNFVDEIRILSKDIALIDVMVSYAKCAVVNNLSKPTFLGEDIEIKNGYHPSLNKLNNEIVENDTSLKQGSMIILTGANMSGKSTYLKHNAIICLLAQIGSFVPAEYAKLPILDKIFFRQSSNDDIVNNNSSFMVEMNDLKYILENTTDSSLILLDEPAKSTNIQESGAIVRAYCEYMLKNFKTKIIIATHNPDLTKLEYNHPERVFNYVMGGSDGDLLNNRKIRRGSINKKYALETAALAELPQEILNLAKEYI